MNTPVPDGSYLVYSLGVSRTNVFEGDFTIMEITEGNEKLAIHSRTGPVTLTKSGEVWISKHYTIEARREIIRSNPMMIGKATNQLGMISSFVAIQLQADLSPILIDEPVTNYEIFFQDDTEDGTLGVEVVEDALTFSFTIHETPQTPATKTRQAPGRFHASPPDGDTSGDHDLHGFVLPHRIWEGKTAYRVLVGHARRSSSPLPRPDDIDPYVAVGARPGHPTYDGE